MKLHLPVKLFNVLMALMVAAPLHTQGGIIPYDYTLMWGDSTESVLNQADSEESIAFILNSDLDFNNAGILGNAGSRLFIDKADDGIAQSMTIQSYSSPIFNKTNEICFSDLESLQIRNNSFVSDAPSISALINARDKIIIENVASVRALDNRIQSNEDYDAYVYGCAIRSNEVVLRKCGNIELNSNGIVVGNWESYPTYIERAGGAAICGYNILFEDNNDIEVNYNYINTYSSLSGLDGAISGTDPTIFRRNGNITFSQNRIYDRSEIWYTYFGGAAISGGAVFESNKDIFFLNNTVSTSSKNEHARIFGGAIHGGSSFDNNGNIVFRSNSISCSSYAFAYVEGGAVYGGLSMTGNGHVDISENSVILYGYTAYSRSCGGGGVRGALRLENNKSVSIRNNYARLWSEFGGYVYGGAVYGNLTLKNNHDVTISGNYGYSSGEVKGGAIYGAVDITGNRNVVFERNHETLVDENQTYTHLLRSVYSDRTMNLSATTGYSISFYDSVYVDAGGYDGYALIVNAAYTDANGVEQSAGGDVIFTGAKTREHLLEIMGNYVSEEYIQEPGAEQLAASRHSQFTGGIHVCAGSLQVKDEAHVSARSVTVDSGSRLLVSNALLSASKGVTIADGGLLELHIGAANKDTALIDASVYSGDGSCSLKLGLTDVDLEDGRYKLVSGSDIYLYNCELIGMDGWLPDEDKLINDDGLSYDYVRTVWTGIQGSDWDTETQNWVDGGESCVYRDGTPIIFEDAGAGTVNICQDMQPGFVLVNNSEGNDYTWQSSGYGLGGKMSLTKRGDGTLIITNANTYTGDTRVEGGMLVVGHTAALGTGNVYVDGAALKSEVLLNNKITFSGKSELVLDYNGGGVGSVITNNGELSISGDGSLDVSKLKLETEANYRINEQGYSVGADSSGYQVTGGCEVVVIEGNELVPAEDYGWWDRNIIKHDGLMHEDGYHIYLALGQDGVARYGGEVDYSTYYLTGDDDSYSVYEAGKKVVMDSGTLYAHCDTEVHSTGGHINVYGNSTGEEVTLTGTIDDTYVSLYGKCNAELKAQLTGETNLSISNDGLVRVYGENSCTGIITISRASVIIHSEQALGTGNIYVYGGKLYTNGYDIENNITVSGGAVIGSLRLDEDDVLTVGQAGMHMEGGLTLNGGVICMEGGLLSVDELLYAEGSNPTRIEVSNYAYMDADKEVQLMQFDGPQLGDVSNVFVYDAFDDIRFDTETGSMNLILGDKQTWVGGKKDVWKKGDAAGWDTALPFVENNRVIFNTKGTVSIEGAVMPWSVLVDIDKALTFKSVKGSKGGDDGFIAGGGCVVKRGEGTLTMNDGNTYSGGTYIEAGTVKAKGATSFGTGDITISGGTLNLASKAVANDIVLSGAVAVKSGMKYTGDFTLQSGELLKGSALNIVESATLAGGTMNGTLAGAGSVIVTGNVALGNSGKIATNSLLISGTLTTSGKALAMGSIYSAINVNGGSLISAGKISAYCINMNGGTLDVTNAKPKAIKMKEDFNAESSSEVYLYGGLTANRLKIIDSKLTLAADDSVAKPKAQSIVIKGKNTDNVLTGSIMDVAGKMSVTGNLSLSGSTLYLHDVVGATKPKAQGLTVKGNLTLSGSDLTLSGKLSASNLSVADSSLTLSAAKVQTVTVKNSLTLSGSNTIVFDFDAKDGKTYKLFSFKSFANTGADLYSLLGWEQNDSIYELAETAKNITLTVYDSEGWEAYMDSLAGETQVAAAVEGDEVRADAAADEPIVEIEVDPVIKSVADTLVQTTWGTVGASRAFSDTIANRGAHSTTLAEGKGAAWISTMGGSSRISSDAGHAGADYTLTGAAFGIEGRVADKSVIGLAIGNSWGKVSTFSAYPVDQDSTHMGIYGNHALGTNTTLSWAATHTRTESDGTLAGLPAEWTQDALQLDARLTRHKQLSHKTTASAFVGLQYLATDSGEYAGIRTGSLQNLRAEIGVGATHRVSPATLVYGELSFVGDMVRNNPTADLGGYRAHGANPGRAGINLGVGATHQLTEDWSLNASYNFELMQNVTSHSLNLGASYSF